MITRDLLRNFLDQKLGEPKYTHQGLRWNCPKCDHGNKYNLECDLDKKVFNCWSCKYSGVLRMLMEDYAFDISWSKLPEFKKEKKNKEDEIVTKELNYPSKTIPFYMNSNVSNYLITERGMDKEELIKRNVSYVYSQEEMYYDHICFPYYRMGIMIGACLQNFTTKKYRNLGPLDFVPYGEFINKKYPITITEGNYDALSGINAIPMLITNINKETLKFVENTNVILALDNTIDIDMYMSQMNKLSKANIKSLTLFDMRMYKDMNEYYLMDKKSFISEYNNCFNKVFGKFSNT